MKDGGGSGAGAGGSEGWHQPMDVDDGGVMMMMPGELDDGFWQAMFDWGWNEQPLEASVVP